MPDGRSLPQLGTDREDGRLTPAGIAGPTPHTAVPEERKDYFKQCDGERFAGTHLLVDLWEAERLDDLATIEDALRDCVTASGATLLHIHLHHFTPNQGVSGVAVLAESHISIHTWPERGYAALDLFMCGDADPQKAVPVLEQVFRPGSVKVEELRRGRVAESGSGDD